MDVVARVPLEPRRSLYVVEVAGKTLLVGTSEMGLSVLSELDASEVRSRVAARPTFADLVKTAWSKRPGLAADSGHASSRDVDATVLVGTDDKSGVDAAVRGATDHSAAVDATVVGAADHKSGLDAAVRAASHDKTDASR